MVGLSKMAVQAGGLAVSISALLAGSAYAADLSDQGQGMPPAYYVTDGDLLNRPYLLGDLGRTDLKARGIDISATLVNETTGNVTGGQRSAVGNAGQLAVQTTFDMQKLAGINGGTANLWYVDRWGINSNQNAGSPAIELTNEVFGRGDIVRLVDMSYDQKLFGGWLELKGGRMAVGTDFEFQHCDFVNLTFCGGQPGNINIGGAYIFNWPVSYWGGIAKLNLPSNLQFEVGVYDANPNYLETTPDPAFWPTFAPSYNKPVGIGSPGAGTLTIADLNWKSNLFGLTGLWRVAGFYNDAQAETITTGKIESGLSGGYVSIYQQLRGPSGGGYKDGGYKDGGAVDPNHGLFTFLNATVLDPRTSINTYQVSWGIQQVGGFLRGRPDDSIGFAVGTTHVNSDCNANAAAIAGCGNVKGGGNEIPLEAYYGWQATPWLNLKFDVQYVINPGGFDNGNDIATGAHGNEWVIGGRTTVKF